MWDSCKSTTTYLSTKTTIKQKNKIILKKMQHLNTQNLQQYMQKLKKKKKCGTFTFTYLLQNFRLLLYHDFMIIRGYLFWRKWVIKKKYFIDVQYYTLNHLHLKTYSKSNQKLIKVYDTATIFIKSTKHLLQLLRKNLIQVINNFIIYKLYKEMYVMIGWIKLSS